jgi:flagellar hook-length control protein FliK
MTSQAHEIMRILQQAGDPGPVVRTLQFGLHPRDLGEVRVTLEIGRDRLGVRIETQGEDAARRLELDRGVLDAMLVQAGIMPDRSQIEIRVGRSDMWMQTSLEAQGRPGDQGAEFSTHGGAANHDRRRSDGNSTHDTGKSTSATSAAAFSGLGEPRRGIYL